MGAPCMSYGSQRAERIAATIAERRLGREEFSPAEYRETLSEMSGLLHKAVAAKQRLEKQVQAVGGPAARSLLRELYGNLVAMVEVNGWTVMGTTVR